MECVLHWILQSVVWASVLPKGRSGAHYVAALQPGRADMHVQYIRTGMHVQYKHYTLCRREVCLPAILAISQGADGAGRGGAWAAVLSPL